MNHKEVVEVGRKWLKSRSAVVITEIGTCSEQPDVIGFEVSVKGQLSKKEYRHYGSCLVECKANRSDFLQDKKKYFRAMPELGLGQYRYFLAPKGLIKIEELPENWGLLETTGVNVKLLKVSGEFKEYNSRGEQSILCSTLRRLIIPEGNHISLRVYNAFPNSKNTTTLTINKEIPAKCLDEYLTNIGG